MAGAAYIRELYNKYGAPSFLAAYHAGQDKLDLYLSGAAPLPDETTDYVAALAPNLVRTAPFYGPLTVYGSGVADPWVRRGSGRYAGWLCGTVASRDSLCGGRMCWCSRQHQRQCNPLHCRASR